MALDEDERIPLVESMITQRDTVGPGVDQVVEDGLGDAEPAGCVLAVDDDEVELVVLPDPWQGLQNRVAARTSDDVTEKKQSHSYPARPASGWRKGSFHFFASVLVAADGARWREHPVQALVITLMGNRVDL